MEKARKHAMRLYAAIDLHSNNNYLIVSDEQDQVVLKRKQANVLSVVLPALEPFREQLVGIVVESTYNWYWLVDGLMEAGWAVHLAHPAGNEQYRGIKYTNDWSDAQWLAHLLRLGLLKEGTIYPKAERAVRDLLRERGRLVQEHSAHVISLEGLVSRVTGHKPSADEVEHLEAAQLEKYGLREPLVREAVAARLAVLERLNEQIRRLEKQVHQQVNHNATYERLQTVWGVGKTLSRTILLETGPLSRFAEEGNYLSYCRMVESQRLTNGKKKGQNNRKCGNRYLCWAFMEAAHFAARYHPEARAFVDRKSAGRRRVLGLKALASKLCRATYFVMREGVAFDPKRLFGSSARSGSGSRVLGVGAVNPQV
jgi:transposase